MMGGDPLFFVVSGADPARRCDEPMAAAVKPAEVLRKSLRLFVITSLSEKW